MKRIWNGLSQEPPVLVFEDTEVDVDVEKVYRLMNDKYGTYVGPGHWFEQSKRYMRIGYGWPLHDELERGLRSISDS